MTQCLVYDHMTKESEYFFTLTAAKKWMRERQKQGHEVEGSRIKVYSNGDTVNCGKIRLTGCNKSRRNFLYYEPSRKAQSACCQCVLTVSMLIFYKT